MIYIKPEVYGSSDLTSGGSQIRPPQDLACHMAAKRDQILHFLRSSVGPMLKLQYVVHETGSGFRFLCQALFAVFSVGLRRCATMHCLRQNLHEGSTSPSPRFLPPPLSCPQGGSNYNSFWRQKMHNATLCSFLYNSTVCAHKKTLLISSNFKPNVAYQ